MKSLILITFTFLCLGDAVVGQAETLTNRIIIEMARSGLGEDIILAKIKRSDAKFDVSSDSLLDLKKNGVSNAVILLMVEKHDTKPPEPLGFSESSGPTEIVNDATPKELLARAKTIALEKSSAQPSRQALEKELLKRPEWKEMDLSIHRYKESADLYVEIGYVSMSWITHRYVYRIYDRRTGTVLAAGETTSWGSLAQNLAKHISRSLSAVGKS